MNVEHFILVTAHRSVAALKMGRKPYREALAIGAYAMRHGLSVLWLIFAVDFKAQEIMGKGEVETQPDFQ